jgi:ABC-type transport system involved in multi-copper enzyme maturation permease subunit
MLQIMKVTLKEVTRKRIVLLITAGTIIYLILYGMISILSRDAVQNGTFFMKSSVYISALGLYFSYLITVFMAIMASVGIISAEMESGILYAVISRPVKRQEYILGKYLGLVIMITIYSLFLYTFVFLISAILNGSSLQNIGFDRLLYGLLLFILQPVAILSLCIYGSVSFKTMSSGIFAIFIYILGLLSGVMEQAGLFMNNDILYQWGIAISLLSPFDVIYRKIVWVIYGGVGLTNPIMPGAVLVPGTIPSNWMLVYIALYSFALLYFAIRKFSKKDL